MSTERKAGRRPGDPEVTRNAILASAREVFGDAGFDRATIRAIAARAEVDPALVHHHFGTKQDLFASAHQLPTNPAEMISQLVGQSQSDVPAMLVRLYLEGIAVPGSAALSLLKAAATNDAAARMLREFIESILLDNAHQLTDQPDARLRIALVGSQMIGLAFARTLVGLSELQVDSDELVRILAPVVRRYLYEPLGPDE